MELTTIHGHGQFLFFLIENIEVTDSPNSSSLYLLNNCITMGLHLYTINAYKKYVSNIWQLQAIYKIHLMHLLTTGSF